MKTIALCCAILVLPIASNAQDVWVLWTQPQVLGYVGDNLWLPLDSFESRQDCLAALSRHFFQGKDGGWWREIQFGKSKVWERGVCLPATVTIPGKEGVR